MRAASPSGPTTDSVSISLVTGGAGTSSQTTTQLGTISVPNTGSYQTYAWTPLKTNTTTFATFTGGSVETLQARTDHTGYNVNFYILVTTNIQAPWIVAPAAPAVVTATPGNAQVALNWTDSPSATAYNVLRSTSNGPNYELIGSNVTTTAYTDNGLANGTTYYYVISSVSVLGMGANSQPVSATPAGPVWLTAGLSASSQIVLSWTTNGNGGLLIPCYSPSLTPPIAWRMITNAPVLSNGQWMVALPLGTNASGYYKLQ
jgi:cellulose 1,4-beta-cellobiosidase